MIKKLNISTSRLYKVTKSAISSQQKRDLLWNSKFNPIHGGGEGSIWHDVFRYFSHF